MKKNKMDFLYRIVIIIWFVFMLFIIYFALKNAPMITNNIESYPISFAPIFPTNHNQINSYLENEANTNKENDNENVVFFYLSENEKYIVESIVCGEAGNQPYNGKVAVANCILNACIKENMRPQEIQSLYQYAGWKPIEEFESECMAAYGNTVLADEVREAVSQVFDKGDILNDEMLWFYAPNVSYSSWHESQKYIMTVGAHKFFAPY